MSEAAIIEAPIAADDAAWAAINTPLSVDELLVFCQDIERLFRINPMLEFSDWESLAENRFRMVVINSSQPQPFELQTDMDVESNANELVVSYLSGIKSRTIFRIEPSEFGSKLTLIEEYQSIDQGDESQLAQVDKSLVNWADYLQRYLITWKKWSKYGWWRWYMKRVWQPMKPSGRRITYMFWWITLVEVALILLGAGIYWSEYR